MTAPESTEVSVIVPEEVGHTVAVSPSADDDIHLAVGRQQTGLTCGRTSMSASRSCRTTVASLLGRLLELAGEAMGEPDPVRPRGAPGVVLGALAGGGAHPRAADGLQ
jgi:hypothetical protein